MNTPADRDYIDAKAEAIAANLSLDAVEYQAKTGTRLDGMSVRMDGMNVRMDGMSVQMDGMNNRLDMMEQAMQSGFQSIREEIATKIAQSQAELIKWMVATILAGVAISTSITAVLLNSATQKAQPPTPIVIYAQPNTK